MSRAARRYRRTVIESFRITQKPLLARLREFVERPVVQGASVAVVLVCGIALGLMIARWTA